MPFVETGDLRTNYDLVGPAEAPVLVLSHSLGQDLTLWDPQVAALATRFRTLRYDLRGHGATSATPGPYSIAQLGTDVLDLLDALGLATFSFCGLSIGGLIGIWLGGNAGGRVARLALCSTAVQIGSAETWNARIETVRRRGTSALVGLARERWFTPAFLDLSPDVVAETLRRLEDTPREGYVGCCQAIRDADLASEAAAIRAPTLVLSASHDPATPPGEGRALAARVPGARYVELPASHLSNLEAPAAFTDELVRFLTG
jgi:3-oxoadipate enol-lactonase